MSLGLTMIVRKGRPLTQKFPALRASQVGRCEPPQHSSFVSGCRYLRIVRGTAEKLLLLLSTAALIRSSQSGREVARQEIARDKRTPAPPPEKFPVPTIPRPATFRRIVVLRINVTPPILTFWTFIHASRGSAETSLGTRWRHSADRRRTEAAVARAHSRTPGRQRVGRQRR